MSQLNEVNIEEKQTVYDIQLAYHSDRKCQNYDAVITGIEEADGDVSIRPWGSENYKGSFFEFDHSDPDRAIAIAQMILAFAQMVKNHNKKDVDVSEKL